MTIVYSLAIFIIIQIGRFFLRRIKGFEGVSNFLHPVSIIWPIIPWIPPHLESFGYFLALFFTAWFILRAVAVALSLRLFVPSLPRNVLEIILLIVVFLVLLNAVLHIKLTGLIVSSAVLTAVVGFALQDILANLFYGIVFSVEKPFKIGEWVSIADQTGKIFKVNWRAIYIKTLDNRTVIVPNLMVSRQEIVNYSYPDPLLRRSVAVSVGYNHSPEEVKKTMLEAIRDVDGALQSPPPDIDFVGFGDHAIQYELRFWIKAYEYHLQVEDEVGAKLWHHFRRKGIEIPFPIRTVYIKEAPGTREVKRGFYKEIEILRMLTDEEVAKIADRARIEEYSEGETIVHQGDDGDSLYVITDGTAEVVLADAKGIALIVNTLDSGAVFGEMSLLTGEKRSATVRARTDLQVIVIDKTSFRRILLKNPKIVEAMSKLLAERQQALLARKQQVTEEEETPTARTILDRIKYFFGI